MSNIYCVLGYLFNTCGTGIEPIKKFIISYTYYITYDDLNVLKIIEKKIENECSKRNNKAIKDLSWYRMIETDKYENSSKVLKIESNLLLKCLDEDHGDNKKGNEDFYKNFKVFDFKIKFKYGFNSLHENNYDFSWIKDNIKYGFYELTHVSGLEFKNYICCWGCPFIEMLAYEEYGETEIDFDFEKFLEFKKEILDIFGNENTGFSFMMCSNCCT